MKAVSYDQHDYEIDDTKSHLNEIKSLRSLESAKSYWEWISNNTTSNNLNFKNLSFHNKPPSHLFKKPINQANPGNNCENKRCLPLRRIFNNEKHLSQDHNYSEQRKYEPETPILSPPYAFKDESEGKQKFERINTKQSQSLKNDGIKNPTQFPKRILFSRSFEHDPKKLEKLTSIDFGSNFKNESFVINPSFYSHSGSSDSYLSEKPNFNTHLPGVNSSVW